MVAIKYFPAITGADYKDRQNMYEYTIGWPTVLVSPAQTQENWNG